MTRAPGLGDRDGVDLLAHYRWAVQSPDTHARLLEIVYERVRGGRRPSVLREDFAGTSAESVAWIALGGDRRAVAVDRDPDTLAWARRRAARMLGDDLSRLTLLAADVLDVAPPAAPPADLVSAMNFSACYFVTRDALVRYLAHARRCLAPEGVLVLNLFGGGAAMRARVDRSPVCPDALEESDTLLAPFEYAWEQRAWDAVTQVLDCRIHFRLGAPDDPAARELRDAFQYRFRLWGLAEMREALREAGFADVQVWRHTFDPARGEDGLFLGAVESFDEPERWTAYVVALR